MPDLAKLLEPDGAVGIILTDTVYGIVAKASSPKAVARLYAVKGRMNRPGTIIGADIDQFVNLGLKRRYLRAVESYWPGPISVEIPCGQEDLDFLHLGTHNLAVRIPDNARVLEILRKTGPLMTTSANKSGKDTAVNVKEAKEYFGKQVDFYIDGGESKKKASTVIKVVDDEVVILRQGDVQLP